VLRWTEILSLALVRPTKTLGRAVPTVGGGQAGAACRRRKSSAANGADDKPAAAESTAQGRLAYAPSGATRTHAENKTIV
jgi:hypothetical protein